MVRPKGKIEQKTSTGRDPLLGMVVVGVVFLMAWTVIYFTSSLQNQWSFSRVTVLAITPDILLSNLISEPDLPSGLRYLPQRFDLIATAAFLLIGASSLGDLFLRAIRIERKGLDGLEWLAFAIGSGLSIWSLFTLACGLGGWLSRPLFATVLMVVVAIEAYFFIRERRHGRTSQRESPRELGRGLVATSFLAMAPFLVAAVLGAMLPPVDFDVKEYHLGGPKEWFLDGQVRFLPHNVYTSFPFLTEMLSLSAMVLRGDWYRGALAGQLVLGAFFPLTALVVFLLGRRLFGGAAGLIGAVVYVTTPWVYRIAVIAYAEGGLTCYVALSVLVAAMTLAQWRSGGQAWRNIFLAGLFAGSGMACKYPGIVQAVIPIGGALLGFGVWQHVRHPGGLTSAVRSDFGESTSPRRPLIAGRFRELGQLGGIYALGVLLAVGPWLLKNLVETGNPVYPLLWSVFGGRDWDASLNAQWRAAHSSSSFLVSRLFSDAFDVAVRSNWQSLLVFGLAPFSLLRLRSKAAVALWSFALYLLAAWWLLTHRIDRFWLPVLPVVAVLAGAGVTWVAERLSALAAPKAAARRAELIWRTTVLGLFAIAIPFNLAVVTSGLSGPPNYLADLGAAARVVETPNLAILNDRLPAEAKVLLVGEAEVFDARFPVVYNTVFDRNIFQQWVGEPQPAVSPGEWPLKRTEEIRQIFAENGITHVYVNWREIVRYRTTYGFTAFVTPERFEELQRRGILGDAVILRPPVPLEAINDSNQLREIETRFSALVRGSNGGAEFVAAELYPVNVD